MSEKQDPATDDLVIKSVPSRSPGKATEILETEADNVTGEHIVMDQAGAETITADRVTMTRSGAREIEAKSAQLDQSGVLELEADNAVLLNSTAAVVVAAKARIVGGKVGVLVSPSTTVEGSMRTLIHVGEATGDVKAAFDAKGAMAFGAGCALALLVVRGLLGRLFRR